MNSGFDGAKSLIDEADEELDIEINEAEAPFLHGQSKRRDSRPPKPLRTRSVA
jgi:hypothetical protein